MRSASSFSQPAPTWTSRRRIVLFSVPVIRSTARTELPSVRRWRTSSARSTGKRISPRGRAGRSEKVLQQVRQRKRWLPFRSFPKRLAGVWQAWQCMSRLLVGCPVGSHNQLGGLLGFGRAGPGPGGRWRDYRGRFVGCNLLSHSFLSVANGYTYVKDYLAHLRACFVRPLAIRLWHG